MTWPISVPVAREAINDDYNVADEAELGRFIASATRIIERLKGHIAPQAFTTAPKRAERISGGGSSLGAGCRPPGRNYLIEVDEWPVLSVQSVSRIGGGSSVAVPAEDPLNGAVGWARNDTVVYVPQAGTYIVAYTAGLDEVPADWAEAAGELVAHLWRGSQLNQTGGGGQPALPSDQMMTLPQIVSALPFRVRELLGVWGDVEDDYVVLA